MTSSPVPVPVPVPGPVPVAGHAGAVSPAGPPPGPPSGPGGRDGRGGRRVPAAAVVLAAVLALAGCGGPAGRESASGPDSAAGATGGTHTVRTARGEVSVPDEPRRVVVLDTAELDSAVTLGVVPVGAARPEAGKGFLPHLPAEKLADVENVGVIGEPNLERIAALEPDLILTNAARDAHHYEQLSAIAPTVMTETTGYPWKKNFRVHADALGRTAEARKAEVAYEKHTAEVTGALGGPRRAKALETNVVRFIEGADTRVYGEKSYIGTVLRDVGLGRPGLAVGAKDHGGLAADISPERIDEADADAVFYATYGDPAKSGRAKALRSGLWKDMRAVRAGRAFPVDDELWIQGIGYTAADRILDELEARLAP